MDPHTHLEYALFQLTPTRTRCDLLIFSGNNKEKLASGLVEPFISHLKFFKDQISKGGYSITLRPNTNSAFCFTKYTFQRLVRFINSPEVLERFIRIEKEISQIENSVHGNDGEEQAGEGSLLSSDGSTKKSADPSKLKAGEAGDQGQEENSKIQLQRLLETRKAMLRKEQAMAYARALVAGFDPENMNDLIVFAGDFGASRLREACIEFKDLCKKKHNDGLWMDELAAMAAFPPSELAYTGTSGLLLTTESNASTLNNDLNFIAMQNGSEQTNSEVTQADQLPSTPTNVGMQMPWPNQIPQYMYNFPGPQGPRYPYPYPGMPPYYPAHMSWPPNADDSSHGRHHKSSSKKKSKLLESSEEDEEEEDDDDSNEDGSDSVTDSGTNSKKEKSAKKNRKKSSKTVVIRNINYITSNRKNSDGGTDDSDGDEVDGVLESLAKHHNKSSKSHKKKGADLDLDSESGKRNENWNAFQNLLLKDDVQDEHFTIRNSEDGSFLPRKDAMDMGSENFVKNRPKTGINDSFVVPERSGVNESRNVNSQDFEGGDSFRVKGRDSSDADMVISQRFGETGMNEMKNFQDLGSESSMIRNKREEDWFVVKNSENTIGKSTFDDDYVSMKGDVFSLESSKKIVPIDDSFMVQPQTTPAYDSQWRSADVSMVENANKPDVTDGSGGPVAKTGFYEPDDLYLMVSRDSGAEPPVRSSWTPEIDYGNEVPFTKSEPKPAPVETKEQPEEVPVKTKKKVMKTRPLSKSLPTDKRLPFVSRPIVHKSKREQEDEIRKRVEELAIQRQKRIAERTATKTGAGGSSGSGSKTKTGATTPVKPVNQKGTSGQLKKTSSKAT
ncbi:COP1-interacting protein 7 isoform X2 [Cynara cardunculus var. scolymus]|uniref:COP1-interacting protein 7 isoform X2 n=1 Tax=Cynara cardunculus var. scolymus TaxID=59895 RepID=UPI000D630633|nr:COP1-interacting protein 7 isoform X2 [Cynara cardunculus var. scolymus]